MLDSIPPLVLNGILTCLHPEELIKMRLLCKEVYLATNKLIYKHLSYSNYHRHNIITNFQKRFNEQNVIKLNRLIFSPADFNFKPINNFYNISVLLIRFIREEQLNALSEISPAMLPKLKKLEILNCSVLNLEDLYIQFLKSGLNFPILSEIEDLKLELDIMDNEDFNRIISLLDGNKLKSLEIKGLGLLDISSIYALYNSFENIESLLFESQDLIYNPPKLKAFTSKLRSLRYLKVSVGTITTNLGIVDLFDELFYFPNLAQLSLGIRDKLYENMLYYNPLCSKLNTLELSSHFLNLSKTYIELPNLIEVKLRWHEGFLETLKDLLSYKHIKTLKLIECQSIYDGNKLFHPPEGLAIRRVEFINCNISVNQLFEFIKPLAKLKSIYYEGNLRGVITKGSTNLSASGNILFWLNTYSSYDGDEILYDSIESMDNLDFQLYKRG